MDRTLHGNFLIRVMGVGELHVRFSNILRSQNRGKKCNFNLFAHLLATQVRKVETGSLPASDVG